jgi:hypothetical protein
MPSALPYFVDINAILNKDVYLETVKVCGKEGKDCLPMGTSPAPVCDAINNGTLIPGAELISAFSPFLERQLPIGVTHCDTEPYTAYAGCMTAPCKRTGTVDATTHLPLAECSCPTYTGPYQVGQSNQQCGLGTTNLWSAAYTPPRSPPSLPACIPNSSNTGCSAQ